MALTNMQRLSLITAAIAEDIRSEPVRQAAYIGPDVEDLPLSEDERARLIAAL